MNRKYLVIFAHAIAESFVSQVHRVIVDTLRARGQEVDDCDLYGEQFQPVMTREERIVYHDSSANAESVKPYVERLRRCNALVFVFPTWNYGVPAILKGYIDRAWLPGVAFDVVNGRVIPMLGHIDRFALVTTYGSSWWLNKFVLGDPNKRMFMKGMRRLVASSGKAVWLAQYGM